MRVVVLIGVLHQVTGHVGIHAPLVEGEEVAGVPKHFVREIGGKVAACGRGAGGEGDEMGIMMTGASFRHCDQAGAASAHKQEVKRLLAVGLSVCWEGATCQLGKRT